MLAAAATEHRLWLIGGTLPLRSTTPGKVTNSSCVFAPDGSLAARYDKMHLFRYDNGREQHDEGRVLVAGEKPVAFAAGGLRIGLSVCYDLRFPELYRMLMKPPCDLLAVPSAFTHTTGRAHWELLLRARATENQCYVIAPAQGGHHENGRRTWGHSLIADPWGEVVDVCTEGEGIVTADVDRERIAYGDEVPFRRRRAPAQPSGAAAPALLRWRQTWSRLRHTGSAPRDESQARSAAASIDWRRRVNAFSTPSSSAAAP
jgi:nitrilase